MSILVYYYCGESGERTGKEVRKRRLADLNAFKGEITFLTERPKTLKERARIPRFFTSKGSFLTIRTQNVNSDLFVKLFGPYYKMARL